jgi:hypothetical protein
MLVADGTLDLAAVLLINAPRLGGDRALQVDADADERFVSRGARRR